MGSIFYDEDFRPTLGTEFGSAAVGYSPAVPGDGSCTDVQH